VLETPPLGREWQRRRCLQHPRRLGHACGRFGRPSGRRVLGRRLSLVFLKKEKKRRKKRKKKSREGGRGEEREREKGEKGKERGKGENRERERMQEKDRTGF
jgi:hypothetical protein